MSTLVSSAGYQDRRSTSRRKTDTRQLSPSSRSIRSDRGDGAEGKSTRLTIFKETEDNDYDQMSTKKGRLGPRRHRDKSERALVLGHAVVEADPALLDLRVPI